jgi:hypothetical protein
MFSYGVTVDQFRLLGLRCTPIVPEFLLVIQTQILGSLARKLCFVAVNQGQQGH